MEISPTVFMYDGPTIAYSETVLEAGVKRGAGTVETGVGTAERGAEKRDDGVGQQEKGAMRPPEAFCGRAETSRSLERLDGLSDLSEV